MSRHVGAVLFCLVWIAGGACGGSSDSLGSPSVSRVSVEYDSAGNPKAVSEPYDAAAPGALVGFAWENPSRDLSQEVPRVTFGDTVAPVVSVSDNQLIVMVPKVKSGLAEVTIRAGDAWAEANLDILPATSSTRPAGTLAIRFIDDMEKILTAAQAICEQPAACEAPNPSRFSRIVFLVDISGSMDMTDLGPTRLEVAQQAIGALLDEVAETTDELSEEFGESASLDISLVTFDSVAYRNVNFGSGHADIRAWVEETQFTGSGTYIGEGILGAVEGLEDKAGTIILLSDGADNSEPPAISPIEALRDYVLPAGAIIHTIGLGAPGQEEFDENLLRYLATETGGSYRRAPSSDELRSAYSSIFRESFSASVVTGAVLDTFAQQGQPIDRLTSRLGPMPSDVASRIAAARELVASADTETLSEIDSIIDQSMLLGLTSRLVERSTNVPAAESNTEACDDISDRIAAVLLEGYADLVGSVLLPDPWGDALGEVIGGLFGDLAADLWELYGEAEAAIEWGQRIIEATTIVTNCIDIIGASIDA